MYRSQWPVGLSAGFPEGGSERGPGWRWEDQVKGPLQKSSEVFTSNHGGDDEEREIRMNSREIFSEELLVLSK